MAFVTDPSCCSAVIRHVFADHEWGAPGFTAVHETRQPRTPTGLLLSVFQLLLVSACGISDDTPTSPRLPTSNAEAESLASSDIRAADPVDNVTIYYNVVEESITEAERTGALRSVGVVHASRFHGTRPAAVTMPRTQLEAFSRLSWVRIIEVDSSPPLYPAEALVTPRHTNGGAHSSPLLAQTIPWGMMDIGAPVAHGRQFRGAGVKVAVLDQAVHVTHPDLNIAGCWDNFGAGASCIAEPASWNGTPFDHGTKAAGVIGATDNSIGVLGVAPDATVYSVRVCAPGLGCPDSAVYDALIWAGNHSIDVVSMSLGSCGGSVSTSMAILLAQLANAGMKIVVAGGNGIHTAPNPCAPGDPLSKFATAPGTIAVSAYGTDLQYKAGYQYGSAILFSAPTDVLTTGIQSGGGTDLEVFGGTSAATPHVAASIAVLLSAGFQKQHALTRLVETAYQPPGAGTPHNNFYGFGQIRLGDAAAAKPRVTYLDWCTGTGITTAGLCTMTAHTTAGIAPIQVRFDVTRSDQPGVVQYGWGAPVRDIQVDAGDYTLTVSMYAREQQYLRIGPLTVQTIPVCTGAALLGFGPSGGGSTQAAAVCGGGGGGGEN